MNTPTGKRRVWRVFSTDRFGSSSLKRGTFYTSQAAEEKKAYLERFYREQKDAPHIQVEPGWEEKK